MVICFQRSVISGSADHELKFWDFELIKDEQYSTTRRDRADCLVRFQI